MGDFEGETVTVGTGRFGPYVLHSKKYVSIPKDVDPMEITLEVAISLIEERRQGEAAAHLKSFDEDAELEVMNGRFGPYLKYKGINYKLPKSVKEPANLTYEECMEIITLRSRQRLLLNVEENLHRKKYDKNIPDRLHGGWQDDPRETVGSKAGSNILRS